MRTTDANDPGSRRMCVAIAFNLVLRGLRPFGNMRMKVKRGASGKTLLARSACETTTGQIVMVEFRLDPCEGMRVWLQHDAQRSPIQPRRDLPPSWMVLLEELGAEMARFKKGIADEGGEGAQPEGGIPDQPPGRGGKLE